VINTAISGNTTRELLEGFDWRVRQFAPDVVFIMIGMNDCSTDRDVSEQDFRANLITLCRRVLDLPSIPVLQTTCPILPQTAPAREERFPRYMEVVRQVAAVEAIALVDHAAWWEEHRDSHFYWMSNGFHPNEYGHRAFAGVLFRELGIFDPKSATCSLFIP
jgi:lysophospholipase L1-like esterase